MPHSLDALCQRFTGHPDVATYAADALLAGPTHCPELVVQVSDAAESELRRQLADAIDAELAAIGSPKRLHRQTLSVRCLDEITRREVAGPRTPGWGFGAFVRELLSGGTYRPTIRPDTAERRALADAIDRALESAGSSLRVYRGAASAAEVA